ncbi:MAG: AAA family ATPase [Actinomycetota bacterium]
MENKMISIVSFKGGVGKTAIALNLAKAAGDYDIKALLWEIDRNPGSLSSILDLDPSINVVSAIMNPEGLTYYTHRIKGEKFDVLLGPPDSIIGEEIEEIEKIRGVIDTAKKIYKLMIMDLGPYIDKLLIQIMNESDLILLIVEPEVSSIAKARANIDLITEKTEYDLSNKMWAVINKTTKSDNISFNQISDALKIPVCIKISYDKKYRSKINRIESSVPETKISKGCEKILKRIYPGAKKPEKRKRFLFFKKGNKK